MSTSNLTPNQMAEQILKMLGNKENLISIAYCMTRLRVSVKDTDKVQKDGIKKIEGVMGLVQQDNQMQVVLGPGRVTKVANELGKITGIQVGELDEAQLRKAEIKAKNSTPFKNLLKKVSNIFIPLIPAFIACGLVTGINNIILKADPTFAKTPFGGILGVIAEIGRAHV